jgi:hypothetical protein
VVGGEGGKSVKKGELGGEKGGVGGWERSW